MDLHPSARTGETDEDPSCSGSVSAVPDQLGGVTLERVLGEGGMGRVYLGHHPILDVAVAVKVMHHRGGDRNRFLTEARLAARVQHEHIVRILHAGDEGGYRFLVLEYVAGRTLKQLVRERGRLPWREAASYLLQAAQGLAAAHRLGIIHRDVKPSNLLLSAEGRIKVADLGVARALIGSGSGSTAGDSEDTSVGSIVGTPAYMAPEQALDPHLVTPAADIYGLGATFYYLLTGEVPFPNRKFSELLKSHHQAAVPDPGQLATDLPGAVRRFTQRLLAKEAHDRPADGTAVVGELEQLLGLATASTTMVPGPLRRNDRRMWWVAAAAGLAGVSTLLLGWGHGDDAQIAAVAAEQHPPVPAPAAAPAFPATPARAVFTLAGTLPAAAQAGLAEACSASGLPVIERARIDAIIGEQRLLTEGRLDPAGAIQLGRLVGGHIALFAEPVENLIEVRCVLVETGEVVASRLVAPGDTRAAASAELALASTLLPVRCAVELQPAGAVIRAGTRHGLHQGDRLVLRRTPAGPEVASATVSAVEANRATLAILPAGADVLGTMAERQAP